MWYILIYSIHRDLATVGLATSDFFPEKVKIFGQHLEIFLRKLKKIKYHFIFEITNNLFYVVSDPATTYIKERLLKESDL